MPLPGTELRAEMIKDGRILADGSDTNWDTVSGYDINIKPLHMSVQELQETVLEMWETVYSDFNSAKRVRHMINHKKNFRKAQKLESVDEVSFGC